jgi:two-component system, NarL family, invasion response regulator UvrY
VIYCQYARECVRGPHFPMNYPPLQPPFRVMIVDDHKFVVELLAQRLSAESKVEIVGMANRGSAALHIAKNEQVDIVLLDMELDQEDGIHVARGLLEINPAIRIVGLSVHDVDHHPISLLEIGGLGFISKTATGREIIDAITRVAAGEMAISPKIAVYLATQFKNPSPIDQIRSLSPKELEVLKYIAQGFSISEIAGKCAVTEKTTQSHRGRLKKKLDVVTDVELCLIAIKSGLISIHDL